MIDFLLKQIILFQKANANGTTTSVVIPVYAFFIVGIVIILIAVIGTVVGIKVAKKKEKTARETVVKTVTLGSEYSSNVQSASAEIAAEKAKKGEKRKHDVKVVAPIPTTRKSSSEMDFLKELGLDDESEVDTEMIAQKSEHHSENNTTTVVNNIHADLSDFVVSKSEMSQPQQGKKKRFVSFDQQKNATEEKNQADMSAKTNETRIESNVIKSSNVNENSNNLIADESLQKKAESINLQTDKPNDTELVDFYSKKSFEKADLKNFYAGNTEPIDIENEKMEREFSELTITKTAAKPNETEKVEKARQTTDDTNIADEFITKYVKTTQPVADKIIIEPKTSAASTEIAKASTAVKEKLADEFDFSDIAATKTSSQAKNTIDDSQIITKSFVGKYVGNPDGEKTEIVQVRAAKPETLFDFSKYSGDSTAMPTEEIVVFAEEKANVEKLDPKKPIAPKKPSAPKKASAVKENGDETIKPIAPKKPTAPKKASAVKENGDEAIKPIAPKKPTASKKATAIKENGDEAIKPIAPKKPTAQKKTDSETTETTGKK